MHVWDVCVSMPISEWVFLKSVRRIPMLLASRYDVNYRASLLEHTAFRMWFGGSVFLLAHTMWSDCEFSGIILSIMCDQRLHDSWAAYNNHNNNNILRVIAWNALTLDAWTDTAQSVACNLNRVSHDSSACKIHDCDAGGGCGQ